MGSEQELIEKLMISKKIMDKHNNMGRGQSQGNDLTSPMVEEFTPIKGQYNLPQEFLSEESAIPRQTNNELPTSERILNSRLPDEIKRLMMEHPIQQPTMGTSTGSVLSNELIEKATRLMNNTPNINYGDFEIIKEIKESKFFRELRMVSKEKFTYIDHNFK